AISRGPDGAIAWGRANGEPLDFVVVMRRFDQADLLEHVAGVGGLSSSLGYALTAHIAAFHEKAEQRPDRGGTVALTDVSRTNIRVLRDCRSAGFDGAQIDRREDGLSSELARIGEQPDERREAGRVRRCH